MLNENFVQDTNRKILTLFVLKNRNRLKLNFVKTVLISLLK